MPSMPDLAPELLRLPDRGPWSRTCLHELARDGDAVELVLERERFRRVAIALPVAVGVAFAGVLAAVPDEPGGFSDAAVVAVAVAVVVAMLLSLRKYRAVEARRGPALRLEAHAPEPLVLPRAGRRVTLDEVHALVLVDGEVDLHGDLQRAWLLTILVPAEGGGLERHDLSRSLDREGQTRLAEDLAAALGVGLTRRTL